MADNLILPVPKNKKASPTANQASGLPDFSVLGHGFLKSSQSPFKEKVPRVLRRAVKIGLVLAIVLGIYHRYFLYLDVPNGCLIHLRPSYLSFSNVSIKEALGIIKQALPADYKKVCDRVGAIDPNFSCGGFGGGCFWVTGREMQNPKAREKKATIDISTNPAEVAYAANMIIHETCHAYQYYESRPFSEPECYAAGDGALKKLISY